MRKAKPYVVKLESVQNYKISTRKAARIKVNKYVLENPVELEKYILFMLGGNRSANILKEELEVW